jgi:hypothetical protein
MVDAALLMVPFARERIIKVETLKKYEAELYQAQGAIKGNKADRFIAESEQKFLAQVRQENLMFGEPQAGPAVKAKRRRPDSKKASVCKNKKAGNI